MLNKVDKAIDFIDDQNFLFGLKNRLLTVKYTSLISKNLS